MQTNNYRGSNSSLDIDFIHFRSGTLVKNIGFEWMMFGIGILCFCYAPLLLLLKAPPTKEEKKVGDDNECDDDGVVNDAFDVCEENNNKTSHALENNLLVD